MGRRILLAWELGSGYGHLMPLRAIAQQLQDQGHHCSFALRELTGAERLGLHSLGPVHAAPLAIGRTLNPVRIQASYASLLHNCGFDEADHLASRIRAWRQLLQDSRADAVVIDHAPTALLAARSLKLPIAATGTAFTLPPPTCPLAAYPGLQVSQTVLARNETQVLRTLNRALERFGAPPYSELRQLFDGVEPGLKTYTELDHYGLPRDEPFIGLPDLSGGLKVDWGAGGEKRLFAYLRPFPGLEGLLEALSQLRVQVLVRIAELDPGQLARYQRPGLVFVDRDVWLRQAAETCDAFVNYGAHGATAEMLLAGKPALLLPDNVERQLLARRARALGAALTLNGNQKTAPASALQQLLEDTTLHQAASRFASRYAGRDRRRIVPDWVDGWLTKFQGL